MENGFIGQSLQFELNAVNCKRDSCQLQLSRPSVHEFIRQSLSESTRRAYAADLQHFEAWGGSVPASPETMAAYLAELAASCRPATLSRRIASISKAHDALGASNPTKSEMVRSVMRGIRRTLGTAQREAKPLLKEDLFTVLETIGDRPKDVRDRALLLIGFAGAFRRSELVALDVADIEHVRQGIVLTLRRSKTDQAGQGRRMGIPFGRTRWCPVQYLADWLDHAEIEAGPVFRGINRHGHVADQRLSGEAVCGIVKQRVQAAGFDPAGFAGHSLRAGLLTSAAEAGASSWKLRQQSGHRSEAMLSRYIRSGQLFEGNAAGLVL